MGKVHLLHLKFFAIQIGKNAGIGGKTKAKLVGIQRLMVVAVALVLGVVPYLVSPTSGCP